MLEQPDHATIARFVVRHEAALAELFGQVLGLCDQAGLVKPGVVAIDGTRLAGNTSRGSNRDFGQIAREILAEAKATDEAEDELYGDARGDELPEQLRTREGRREFLVRPGRSSLRRTAMLISRAARSRNRLLNRLSSTPSRSSRVPRSTRLGPRGTSQQEQHRWQTPDPIPRVGSSGCCSPRSGWRTISTRSWPATPPTSSFG
jgi:hypothetical protein